MLDPFTSSRDRSPDDPLDRKGRPVIGSASELRRFLAERDGETALEELLDGDRLEVAERVGVWMEKRCYILDARKLIYTSLPMVINAGPDLGENEDLEPWVEARIETAAGALLELDAALARQDAPVDEPAEPRFTFFMRTLRFNLSEVRRAVVAANELRTGERHVFYHCFVIGKGFGRYEEEVGIKAEQAQALFVRAIDKLSDAVGDVE
jgi:hypothetical protein